MDRLKASLPCLTLLVASVGATHGAGAAGEP